MADTNLTGLFSTHQINESERLAARKHLISERQLAPEEARDLWTFGGDAEAIALFRSLSKEEQRRRKAEFLAEAKTEAEDELRTWCERADQGGWPCARDIREQMLQDQTLEDAAKAEYELDPQWVKLMEQARENAAKRAEVRRTSKAARRRVKKGQARSNSEPATETPVPVQTIQPVEAVAETTTVKDEVAETKSETPAEHSLEAELTELKASGNAHKREVKAKIKKIEAQIRTRAAELHAQKAKLETKRLAAQQKLDAAKATSKERFGLVCSHPDCAYGLQEHNRHLPSIDYMSSTLGRDVEIEDLESFVRCSRHVGQNMKAHHMTKTVEILTKRDIRRTEDIERQKVIEADRAARAQAEADANRAQADRKKALEMLKLRARGRYSHGGPIRRVG